MAGFNFAIKFILFYSTILVVGPIVGVENVEKFQFFHPLNHPPVIRPVYFLQQNFQTQPAATINHHEEEDGGGEAGNLVGAKLNKFHGRKDSSSASSEEVIQFHHDARRIKVSSEEEDSRSTESGEFSQEFQQNDNRPGIVRESDESTENEESRRRHRRPPLLGDRGVMEDPSHVNRFRFLWPDATTTVTLTKRKRTRSPYHFSPHGYHHAPSSLSYDSYLDQMNNAAKGLDFDGLTSWSRGDYGIGDGWESEEYGLTDDEILHSKGYKKYRKHLKKNAKHLKKKLALVKWFQKFLVEKKFFVPGITELDVIAPN